ncbi:MAG: hypothetical protein LBC41_01585 [Clostridiales bacterium]|jgi:hypothetical protein|nr:hypothetical protein [Clostridiales bacterium]
MGRKRGAAHDHIKYENRGGPNDEAYFIPIDVNHGGKEKYLGTVVDKENGIFFYKKAFYGFTIDKGNFELTQEQKIYYHILRCSKAKDMAGN